MQRMPVRETVDLSGFPDLIVVLLGFKVRSPRALLALRDVGRGLAAIRRDPPDGLLANQSCLFGWNHVGIRQYWRDLDSLERFTRQNPHSAWWSAFLKDSRNCGFWHETYRARGGFEAIYVGLPERTGFGTFAPIRKPIGSFMSSRVRLEGDALGRSQPG